jgi:hypothetical protein
MKSLCRTQEEKSGGCVLNAEAYGQHQLIADITVKWVALNVIPKLIA